MKDHYLYAIVVKPQIWGKLSVCAGNHYEIHAIPKVSTESEYNTVASYVWQMQIDCAHSYGSPSWVCINCSSDLEDCECDAQEPEMVEDEASFIESNSAAIFVKYDETNIDHVLCPGAEKYRDTTFRDEILKAREEAEILRKLDRLRMEVEDLKTKATRIETERARLLDRLKGLNDA